MTQDDKQILDVADTPTLARWWCELNRYEWPAILPDPEPPTYGGAGCRRWKIMCAIEGRIGMKECLREWNRERMTNEEFEAWWAKGRYRPAPPRESSGEGEG